MFRNILLLFENDNILAEALVYVRELAIRTDAAVTLLILVPMSFTGHTLIGPRRSLVQDIEIRMGKCLSESLQPFIQSGIEVNSALKIGDPAEELMKFLADHPPFQSLVWGSDRQLPDSGRKPGRHWISKVLGNLECSLLTVSKRGLE
ncbi:MAG: universal stress protein [Desulforhopalus sp.]|nr:universal stress protein [Desulforhopalus sp.]